MKQSILEAKVLNTTNMRMTEFPVYDKTSFAYFVSCATYTNFFQGLTRNWP